ncbi:MAG: hypothetical protein KBA18_03465, partial [Kiritimatiellae bacterium]|nr:hypothetical protein [Kiritimatiellia bacterium]
MKPATLRPVFGWFAAVLLAGCDYTVPLAEKPETQIDTALVGQWQITLDGKDVRLSVLALAADEYLVAYPSGTPDTLYARACLCQGTEFALVQLRWFGSANARADFSAHPYQYAAYGIEGDTLVARLINPEVVKPAQTAAALLSAIKANNTNPDLFRSELRFTRV